MITKIKPQANGDTRRRLLDEGLKLFARNGYAATTVGEIERAAGLAPRRGGLYRHFASKAALLDAAVAQHAADIERAREDLTAAPDETPEQTAFKFSKWMLADMDRQRTMTQILERSGPRVSKARSKFRANSQAGFLAVSEMIGFWAKARNVALDPRAMAVILMGAIVNFRRSEWTLGKPPLDMSDEDLARGVAGIVASILTDPAPSAGTLERLDQRSGKG